MRRTFAAAFALSAGAVAAHAQSGGPYNLAWSTLDGGGGTSAGGVYTVRATIGQPDAGTLHGAGFTLFGGFWSGTHSLPDNPQTDTDHDGIPDAWERKYGLDPTDPSDAVADNDRDGMTNLEEYWANTNPLDSRSTFTMSVAGVGPSPMVTWVADPERRYRIWMREGLDPSIPWVDSGFGIIQPPVFGVGPSPMRAEFEVGPSPKYRLLGVGSSALREISGVGPSPMRFFRLEAFVP